MNLTLLLIVVCCVLMSFFLSGMEAGVLALSRLRVRRLMRSGHAQAKRLNQYLENPEDFLWTILVGNTLANFVAASLMVVVLRNWLRPWPGLFWLVFIIAGLLFYGACELLPKMVFRLYPTRLSLALSGPFGALRTCLRPFVWLLARISALLLRVTGNQSCTGRLFGSREELRLVMQESAQDLSADERSMINRVLDLQSLSVREAMVPTARLVAVTTDSPVSQVLELCRQRGLSRLPVWRTEHGQRRIVGLLNLRSLLYEADLDLGKRAGDYLSAACYLDADTRLEDAMRYMQRNGQRLGIVLARDKSELGIVSLQDILKTIFGEVKL